MPTRPEQVSAEATAPQMAARGLSILLAPKRGADESDAELAPLAKRFAAALAETLAARFGLRAGFAPDQAPAPQEPGPGLSAALRGGDGVAAVEIGQSAIYDVVDALFGGDGSVEPYRETRKPTDLERAVFEGFAPTFAQALCKALERDDIAPGKVVVTQERAPGLSTIGLKMRLIGRESRLTLALPRAWVGLAAKDASNAAPSLDALDLDLTVSLRDAPRPLADIIDLNVGDVLALGVGPDAPALVAAQGVALFEAKLGQNAGRYTIRLERRLDGAAPFFEEHGQ